MKTGKMVLEGLKDLRLEKEPTRFNYSNYGKFLKDPLGRDAKHL